MQITEKQLAFIEADATEVLFGGAAGGGKSYAQILDAMLYALKYAGSKQLILRRTYPELEKSLIRTALAVYPRELFTYSGATHTGKWKNGSLIDFGYSASENDVFMYQSAEYDVIRFDEATLFTEFQYTFICSRLRGANDFPKQIKSTSNPGNVGHMFFKKRFIDPSPPNTLFSTNTGTRIFIPSKVQDNKFLMAKDPDYVKRLESLPDTQKRAFLYGDWDVFEGQYFPEFSREIHVIEPFPLPTTWRRYRAIDYGLDMFACLWIAIDPDRNVYVYKEVHKPDLVISAAAKAATDMTGESIYCTLAPPDMWSRAQETGRCKADIFAESGLRLVKTSNDREAGWLAIKELLKVSDKGVAKLHIFNTCVNLITNLPMLQHDPKYPTDCATEPHEVTHDPDALRAYAIYWSNPSVVSIEAEHKTPWAKDLLEDYNNASPELKAYMEQKYGKPRY